MLVGSTADFASHGAGLLVVSFEAASHLLWKPRRLRIRQSFACVYDPYVFHKILTRIPQSLIEWLSFPATVFTAPPSIRPSYSKAAHNIQSGPDNVR